MTECSQSGFEFEAHFSRRVVGRFQGSRLTTDGGALLLRTQASTNPIESCLSTVRHIARNVKRWQGGNHTARWTAAGLLEAERRFRKVKGYRELRELARKLNPELQAQAQVA